jgi:CheY-like chemotaxis protein
MTAPVQNFLSGARILVIDDHEDSRNLANLVLEHAGYKVSLASTGVQGLELALLELPDLILADLILPEIDGLELVERLRLHPATSDVRIIALTADARPAVHDDAMRAGCNAFLVKPFPIATLRSVVLEQLLLARLYGRSRFISL